MNPVISPMHYAYESFLPNPVNTFIFPTYNFHCVPSDYTQTYQSQQQIKQQSPQIKSRRQSISDRVVKLQQPEQPQQKYLLEHIKTQDDDRMEKAQRYGKKNTEANIVNQVFSYLSNRNKSGDIVGKMLKNNQEKIQAFYLLLSKIKKNNKKYINRKYLVQLSLLKQGQAFYRTIAKNLKKVKILPIHEMRLTIRLTIMYYLDHICTLAVLTSTKVKDTKYHNLQRRRQVHSNMLIKLRKQCSQQLNPVCKEQK